MKKKTFKIVAVTGLHDRPATQLVQVATHYDSKIQLIHDGQAVDLKSIMGVMSLGVGRNEEVTITTEGSDEITAMKSITKALKREGLSN